uniref:Uncharacterized protein n=1 Tax=Cucumis melo TaxID=3656 RepID=A0A9I9ELW4_CUCME
MFSSLQATQEKSEGETYQEEDEGFLKSQFFSGFCFWANLIGIWSSLLQIEIELPVLDTLPKSARSSHDQGGHDRGGHNEVDHDYGGLQSNGDHEDWEEFLMQSLEIDMGCKAEATNHYDHVVDDVSNFYINGDNDVQHVIKIVNIP